MPDSLLIFVHPALEKSQVNSQLLPIAKESEAITVNDLYEKYPDFHVNAQREQELLEAHSRLIFQFPFYWYSSPALLKEWLDIVLEYGWAYGRKGKALVGKQATFAITTGGPAESYTAEGSNGFTMGELLRPLLSTFKLCGMEIGRPFYIHNALHLTALELESLKGDYKTWLETV